MRTHAAVSEQPVSEGSAAGDGARGEIAELDFDAIYEAWFQEVMRWARAFGGLDADLEDLVQDVFLVVRRKLPEFDGANLPGWLYRITQRTVSDYRRRAWFRRLFRPKNYSLEEVVDPAESPLEVAERREAQRTLGTILSKMSLTRRGAFILFEIEGYSGEEIARLENIPVKTVYTRLHYARKDFFSLLSKHRQRGSQR